MAAMPTAFTAGTIGRISPRSGIAIMKAELLCAERLKCKTDKHGVCVGQGKNLISKLQKNEVPAQS